MNRLRGVFGVVLSFMDALQVRIREHIRAQRVLGCRDVNRIKYFFAGHGGHVDERARIASRGNSSAR
jgi:hypothetical protein